MPKFSAVSFDRLSTCHPDLQRLMNAVVLEIDIVVVCGHRNEVDQEAAFAAGTSLLHWPLSKHNSTPSMAVDVAPLGPDGKIDWGFLGSFKTAAVVIKAVAARLGISVEWAGDWTKFREYPHWQLKP